MSFISYLWLGEIDTTLRRQTLNKHNELNEVQSSMQHTHVDKDAH